MTFFDSQSAFFPASPPPASENTRRILAHLASWHTLKNELIPRCQFQAREEAKQAIFKYIEVFCNRIRQHTAIGNLSPVDVEAQRAEAA